MLFKGIISAGRKKRHHAAFVDRFKGIVKKTKWDNTIINESNGADMFFLNTLNFHNGFSVKLFLTENTIYFTI